MLGRNHVATLKGHIVWGEHADHEKEHLYNFNLLYVLAYDEFRFHSKYFDP